MQKKIKKAALFTIASIMSLTSLACDPYRNMPDHLVDIYPGVYNIEGINTTFDDYNSGPPPAHKYPRLSVNDLFFIYSTNSGSSGTNFDIWKGWIRFEQKSHLENEVNPKPEIKGERSGPFLSAETGSEANEYGPYLFYMPEPQDVIVSAPNPVNENNSFLSEGFAVKNEQGAFDNYGEKLSKMPDRDLLGANLYFFASDRKGKRNIYFYNKGGLLKEFFGNQESSNESYFSYDYKRNVAYFASDRNGKYDIYRFENKTGNLNFEEVFANKELAKDIVIAENFNSAGNDTCPVFFDDYMIFASDREGGRGGYDIYASKYLEGQGWQKPVNVQDAIDRYFEINKNYLPEEEMKKLNFQVNTASDEFRPFIIEDDYYRQYVYSSKPGDNYYDNPSSRYLHHASVIFSSNRPGGKGGFDLHLGIVPRVVF